MSLFDLSRNETGADALVIKSGVFSLAVMSALRILGFCYLAAASSFAVAIAMADQARLHDALDDGSRLAARQFGERVVQPVMAFAKAQDEKFFDPKPGQARLTMAPPGPNDARTFAHAKLPPIPEKRLIDQPPQLAQDEPLIIAPDLPQFNEEQDQKLAAAEPPKSQKPDEGPIGPAERAAVRARLEESLTPELRANFDLFLFVSKSAHGPLAQRLYVFKKESDGGLEMAYDWAASTGREAYEVSPRGRHTRTDTPRGIYQFDADRMYRRYTSYSWKQKMPFAMFFNWEHEGLETGLAIHAATGGDIAKLGDRASAGCVHISPEHAELLYNLIRADYRGQVPRFAYDARSQTMSNRGVLAHDTHGNLKMASGYRVLIDIEDLSGGNVVAALY